MMARLRASGGYRDLCSFQTATIIYDATYWFCEKFVDPRSRTVDQMVQAARAGRQNIAEGNRASATSSQTELRLFNVARSSFEELLLDYEDFLRHRRQPQWEPDSPEALAVRNVPKRFKREQANQSDLSDQERWALYLPWLDHEVSVVRANALICLIHQANYLLDQVIQILEKQFVEGGGYSEQLATAPSPNATVENPIRQIRQIRQILPILPGDSQSAESCLVRRCWADAGRASEPGRFVYSAHCVSKSSRRRLRRFANSAAVILPPSRNWRARRSAALVCW